MKPGQAEAYLSYFRGRYRDWPGFPIYYNKVIKAIEETDTLLTLQGIDDALMDVLEILQVPCVPREGDKRLFLINRTTVKSLYNVVQDFPFLLPAVERDDFRFIYFKFGGTDTIIQPFNDELTIEEQYHE